MTGNNKVEPRSAWEVKRKIRLPAALANPADLENVERTLRDIDGVLQVSADHAKRTILVRYLVTQTDYQSLERALETAGLPLTDSRWARFKSGWYQSLDLTGRENAGARPSACCNKPPTRS
jgi:hypothetical protein